MEDQNCLLMARIICFSVVALILGVTVCVTCYNVILERSYIQGGYQQTTVVGTDKIVWQKK